MRSCRVLPALLALALLAAAVPADAKTYRWLCRPGLPDNPCTGPLTASVLAPDESVVRVERTPAPGGQPIDCFYVYPTVSSQPGITADLSTDPEQIAIAQQQAQRFKSVCKLYAPIYRQLTIAGIFDQSKITAADRAGAYAGVRDAFRSYLRNDNRGRGFVLLGHSQGSFILRQLIANEVDNRPAVRRRLVSALLLGGNVRVRKGKEAGGDFQHVPACRRQGQIGCVIAYSAFNATPPADASFGRVTSGFGAQRNSRLEILCTNPASLEGGTGRLRAYLFDRPFPGTLGIAVNAFIGPLPRVGTPWVVAPGHYDARCSRAGGANVLRVKASRGARDFVPSPDPGWGWHLADVNIALGNLVEIVRDQTTQYLLRT